MADVATAVAATGSGVAGLDATAYDIYTASTTDLRRLAPLVLLVIAGLLAVLLRSLIAPVYLIVTVGLSYLAARGFASIVFVHQGHSDGPNFIIPILLFISRWPSARTTTSCSWPASAKKPTDTGYVKP